MQLISLQGQLFAVILIACDVAQQDESRWCDDWGLKEHVSKQASKCLRQYNEKNRDYIDGIAKEDMIYDSSNYKG